VWHAWGRREYGTGFGIPEGTGHSESLCEFGMIILKWNLTIGLRKNKTCNYSTGNIFTHVFKTIL